MKYFPRVIKYLKPYWRLAGLLGALIFLGAGFGLLTPWPLQTLVDHVLDQKPFSPAVGYFLAPLANNSGLLLVLAASGALLIAILQNATTVLHEYVSTKIDQNMILDFRSDMMQHAQRLSLTFHD